MDIFAETRAEIEKADSAYRKTVVVMVLFMCVWLAFLMGSVGTALFIVGRWAGVW